MKITVLSHNLSTNAVMRAHRLAVAARTFADVTLLGPVEPRGPWAALPAEPWIQTVPERRFPDFYKSFLRLVEAADGDVLLAVKPQLASFGTALVAAELKQKPVILDLDDLDTAFAPRARWASDPSMTDLHRSGSAVFVSLLTRATSAAAAITVSSTALQKRFAGVLIPHGCVTEWFDPQKVDREAARRALGFRQPTVLFAGTPRHHKGLKPLARAVRKIPHARLAVVCRPKDLPLSEWEEFPVDRLSIVPYPSMATVLAAADVVAIPQLDIEPARYQMPMKVYDAMGMGRPIVASAMSDLPAVLQGCARLVPPGDIAALRAAIRDLLMHPEEAQALGERARALCLESFSMDRVGARLREVVRNVAPKGAV